MGRNLGVLGARDEATFIVAAGRRACKVAVVAIVAERRMCAVWADGVEERD